jgi:hypothetical protein
MKLPGSAFSTSHRGLAGLARTRWTGYTCPIPAEVTVRTRVVGHGEHIEIDSTGSSRKVSLNLKLIRRRVGSPRSG